MALRYLLYIFILKINNQWTNDDKLLFLKSKIRPRKLPIRPNNNAIVKIKTPIENSTKVAIIFQIFLKFFYFFYFVIF